MFGIGLFCFGVSDFKKGKAVGIWKDWQEGLASRGISHQA